jgi:hypothetical protein
MKLKDVFGEKEYSMAKVKSFCNFYELKCHLPGVITSKYIEVRKDLYPKEIDKIIAVPDNKGIFFKIFIITKFGYYDLNTSIDLKSGEVFTLFHRGRYKTNSKTGELDIYIPKDKFDKFVLKYRPLVESFLNNLIKLKKTNICSKACYYKKLKNNNGTCNQIYISKNEFTVKENKFRQSVLKNNKE